jgi:hypothetical protein
VAIGGGAVVGVAITGGAGGGSGGIIVGNDGEVCGSDVGGNNGGEDDIIGADNGSIGKDIRRVGFGGEVLNSEGFPLEWETLLGDEGVDSEGTTGGEC